MNRIKQALQRFMMGRYGTDKLNMWILGAGLLLGFYGIYIVAGYLEILSLYYLTPMKYFDVYAVAREGFSIAFLLLAAVIVMISVAVARRRWIDVEM